MQRVMVLGCGGSGKSTFARELGDRTGLPAVHLDLLFWQPGWTPAPEAQARAALAEALAGERWIADGDFLDDGAADARFARADTVVWLDLPRRLCLWRIGWRLLRDRRRRRPDLPAGCRESFDPAFLRWVWSYPGRRAEVAAVLDAVARQGVTVWRLRSRREVERFLGTA